MAYEQEIDQGRDWDNEDDEHIYDQKDVEQEEFEEYDASFHNWVPGDYHNSQEGNPG